MVSRLITAAVIAVVLVVVIDSLPDIKRYLEIRDMLDPEEGADLHEYGLAEGVLATVRQRAAGRKVAGIGVRFGVRHAVDEESMAQAFTFVAEGTEAAGATVTLVTVPATLVCRDCGLTAETTDVLAVCPACAGENVDITGGDEMTLESITYQPVPAG
jgi:hydrogenase nickel incorporation protein HypA/HybF